MWVLGRLARPFKATLVICNIIRKVRDVFEGAEGGRDAINVLRSCAGGE